ncbi:ribulose-5-phosphate 4-epimerase/fuculose-1-phosphate aldolase [Mycobacterium sp. OAS707]|uniref:3-oxo-tetronate 4-phosphate decarboxylase n=1 Tax=Mycobacterium sp. OAS707 TaxID=2663822 RepID=UPI00178C156D|nr:3-oxo-tetronate 4-phosphate decarboxylase [Mycobacterium sp. OAS707]MBE1551733.1 ribulose-5-phosphate 4-epimerase/fuculose-1-phosphate aldolase [Mycobacterium sp. OAS707]
MSAPFEATARAQVVDVARSIFTRGLTHGRTGNVSLRIGDRILVTPTGSSLGTVAPEDLSVIGRCGEHLDGPSPSKEAFLHAAMLRARPDATAVVHTHSTYSAAVSCLAGLDPASALPPLTAYFVMRVGTLPLLAYHAPGDATLEPLAEATARNHHAILLRNHGPVVAGPNLSAALDALEELEQTAKLFLLLRGRATQPLGPVEVQELQTIS